MQTADPKLRRSLSLALVEDILVKRPFTKVLAMELLNITSVVREQSEFDLARLARECLKNLAGEDLRQLYSEHDGVMAEFEGQYNEVQGSSLENELAKIMSRYAKEGKPQAKPV